MSDLLYQATLHPQQMLTNIAPFMEKMKQLAQLAHIELQDFQIDHIALRINDEALAELARAAWGEYGEEISSAQINGRPIIVFQFHPPLVIETWEIECLELPYPVQGKRYPEQNWEHIEVVIPASGDTAPAYLDSLMKRYPNMAKAWSQFDALGVNVKLSSPQGAGERLANPTIALKWQGVTLKIHPHSLKQVIESERGGQ
ncbi:VOC family protein [Vibrio zhugei]|uniref:VOC family protein n=1 Tax=Vibrio zhugei TaxID=2479546 RepID=A0ABV7CE94_9VIBR|nr:VOC family protein [Vibrio zhugei]